MTVLPKQSTHPIQLTSKIYLEGIRFYWRVQIKSIILGIFSWMLIIAAIIGILRLADIFLHTHFTTPDKWMIWILILVSYPYFLIIFGPAQFKKTAVSSAKAKMAQLEHFISWDETHLCFHTVSNETFSIFSWRIYSAIHSNARITLLFCDNFRYHIVSRDFFDSNETYQAFIKDASQAIRLK